MTALEKYIWIVNTLYEAGERGRSLKEINEIWSRDENVSNGAILPRQTFDRWKGNIQMIFGINIDCRLRDGYRYYISNPEVLQQGGICRWLLDTYTTANTLSQNISIKDRILVEEIPSSHNFLANIISAMKENQVINITHKNFQYSKSFTFPVAPYCLKLFQKRWYMLGSSTNDNTIRIYGIDRIEKMEATNEHFSMPKDFDAKTYFSSFFGVVLDNDVPIQHIVLRADKYHQHYLRSLPLHESQREIFTSEEYADFELTLRPTYDFRMELLRAGNMIEVIEPLSLRQEMREWIRDLWEMYEKG
ncbi:helix-turn-helix transcriptional regulator [Parabacteroides sp.]